MGCYSSNVDLAGPRNLRKEWSKIAAFAPLLANSNLTSLQTLLGGSPGGPQTPTWTGKNGKERTATYSTTPTRGMLDLLENDISPTLSRVNSQAQSAQRTSDIGDVSRLSGTTRESIRGYNPQGAQLLDTLSGQAQSDLDLGAALNPSEQRLIQQSARAGQSARGMGFGPVDAFDEALKSLDYGRGLQNDRRAFASGVIGQNQSLYGDPFQTILGRQSNNVGQSQGFLGAAGGPAGQAASYGSDLFNTNKNAANAANMAEASAGAGQLAGLGSY